MESGSLVVAAGSVLLSAALVLLVLRAATRTRSDLAAARAETAELWDRVESLSAQLEQTTSSSRVTTDGQSAYVITDAGDQRADGPGVPDRLVLSATVGEPLVKVVAFGHGVRRALSAESRNRIGFEMRREVRAARRRRRRESRDLLREARAAQRADQRADQGADPKVDQRPDEAA